MFCHRTCKGLDRPHHWQIFFWELLLGKQVLLKHFENISVLLFCHPQEVTLDEKSKNSECMIGVLENTSTSTTLKSLNCCMLRMSTFKAFQSFSIGVYSTDKRSLTTLTISTCSYFVFCPLHFRHVCLHWDWKPGLCLRSRLGKRFFCKVPRVPEVFYEKRERWENLLLPAAVDWY